MDGLPIIPVTEPSKTLDAFLRWVYPVRKLPLVELSDIADILEASQKYDAVAVTDPLHDAFLKYLDAEPLRVFAIACRLDMESDARLAAQRATLMANTPPFHWVPEMAQLTSGTYFRLLWYLNKALPVTPDEFWSTFSFTHRSSDNHSGPDPSKDGFFRLTIPDSDVLHQETLSSWSECDLFLHDPPDVLLRSSDGMELPAHKIIVSLCSPVLREMINSTLAPQPPALLSLLDIQESSYILYALLRACYGLCGAPIFDDNRTLVFPLWVVKLLLSLQKYKMSTVIHRARKDLQGFLKRNPMRG